eukprot:Phypoly_transcript_11357.p1 GENE.Phypoly_transcript_11357~~Phypoly_transcript_11357.p1  ORF type:complete len:337 (+),score=35.98 Phypoly_transcript_11357:63-1013(+)
MNPHYAFVREQIVALLNELGLCEEEKEKDRRDGVITMGAYIYPDAGPNELLFGTLFVLWLFFFDDIFDESKFLKGESSQAAERTLQMFRTRQPPVNATTGLSVGIVQLERLLLRIFKMAKDLAHGPYVISRFMETCEFYITEGAIPMDKFRFRKELPKLDEYLAVRTIDGAGEACIVCSEIVAHLSLPEHIINEPRIKRMREITGQQIVYSNDIYSYHREKIHNNSVNALNIRCLTKSFNDALTDQINQVNEWVLEFEALKNSLYESTLWENNLDVYITGMENTMMGCKIWSESCTRYDLNALLHITPDKNEFPER